MGVTQVEKDVDQLTVTAVAEYDVPVERAWQVCADPRQLERWWGPPTHPATFEADELAPGARIGYFMTGPNGERYRFWWEVVEVAAPSLLVVRDGFANEDGTPNSELPSTLLSVEFTQSEAATGARPSTVLTITRTYPSREAFDQALAMRADAGMESAMSQIDGVLGG